MIRRHVIALALLLTAAACAGGVLAAAYTGSSPKPATDAFQCARDQIKALGFSQTSYDEKDLLVKAQKVIPGVTRPDVNFWRLLDRLSIQITPGKGEGENSIAASTITVEAATIADTRTQRGPTEVQEKTSETAKEAAQTLIQRCSGS